MIKFILLIFLILSSCSMTKVKKISIGRDNLYYKNGYANDYIRLDAITDKDTVCVGDTLNININFTNISTEVYMFFPRSDISLSTKLPDNKKYFITYESLVFINLNNHIPN